MTTKRASWGSLKEFMATLPVGQWVRLDYSRASAYPVACQLGMSILIRANKAGILFVLRLPPLP